MPKVKRSPPPPIDTSKISAGSSNASESGVTRITRLNAARSALDNVPDGIAVSLPDLTSAGAFQTPSSNFDSSAKRPRCDDGNRFFGNTSDLELMYAEMVEKMHSLSDVIQRNDKSISQLTSNMAIIVNENKNISKELSSIKSVSESILKLLQKFDAPLPTVTRESTENCPMIVPAADSFPALPTTLSFSDVIKKSENVIVIKPMDSSQNNKVTMSEIRRKISPSKKHIVKVKNAANGGVIIECATKEDIDNLKSDAELKLGEAYKVSVPEKRLPKLRVFGISDKMSTDEIKKRLTEQNPEVFRNDSVLNIYSVTAAVNSDRYWFKLECDPTTFSMAITKEKIRLGWDICYVSELIDVRRCFNCYAYGHHSKTCSSPPSCPKCSGDHQVSDCKSDGSTCINCVTSNRDLNLNLDSNHFAWSLDCPVYKRQLDRQRKRVDYGK